MARQRLGVVLLVPQPLATEIDGLRRALGDGARDRIAPHVTLVPPVNVAERDLASAFAVVRRAAAASEPLSLSLGPVATFAPVNPTAYLALDGEPSALASLHELRGGVRQGVLERPDVHDFVPHVTVADELPDRRLDAATSALDAFRAPVTFDRVHVLQQRPDRTWVPVSDAPLGAPSGVVGRGSLPLQIDISGRPDAEAAALLAVDQDAAGLPFAVTARREGEVLAAAWGWTAHGRLELADLVVSALHRGQGIGRHLLAAVEGLAGRRSCPHLGTAAPVTGAPAALLRASGWEPEGGIDEVRRWTRRIEAS